MADESLDHAPGPQDQPATVGRDPLLVELVEKKKSFFERANSYAALSISLIALATAVWSAYDTRVHDKLSLLPAPVWQAEGSLEADEIGLVLTNQGLGPLTLDQLRIYFDGKPINDWGPVMHELTDAYADKDVTASWNLYDTMTIGSKGQVKFFYIKPKFILRNKANVFRDAIDRLFVITRACSVYDDCTYTCGPNKGDQDCISFERSILAKGRQ
jgi:hypothetical protein